VPADQIQQFNNNKKERKKGDKTRLRILTELQQYLEAKTNPNCIITIHQNSFSKTKF
jgi:hypothetical protein